MVPAVAPVRAPDLSVFPQLHLAALGAPRPYVLTQQQIHASQQGAMDGDQLKHLALLADLFVVNRDHVAATEVMTAIGVASVLQSTPESARPDRVMALQQALVHVRFPAALPPKQRVCVMLQSLSMASLFSRTAE